MLEGYLIDWYLLFNIGGNEFISISRFKIQKESAWNLTKKCVESSQNKKCR